MSTLLAKLQAGPLVHTFTATTSFGDTLLSNVDPDTGLIEGLPITGSGIPAGAVITSVVPEIRMSKPANVSAIGVEITQGFRLLDRARVPPTSQITKQPALYLIDGDEDWPGMTGTPSRRSTEPALITLRPFLLVYVKTADPSFLPAPILNALLDTLETRLVPGPNSVWENLGLKGVVHGRIEGKLVKEGGFQDGQAGARVPLAIQVVQGVETVAI